MNLKTISMTNLKNDFHDEFKNVKHCPLPLCCSMGEMYNLIEISDES